MDLITEHLGSSLISTSNYSPQTGELLITFKGGESYKYENVLTEDYQNFIEGKSAGQSFNLFIKKYTGTKLEEYQQINGNG